MPLQLNQYPLSVNAAPVDCYEGDGYLYRGKGAKTENGSDCLAWASLDSSAYYRPGNFPEEGKRSLLA